MAKLSFTHQITERRNFGKTVVNQEMQVVVDYDPEENSIDVVAVNVSQDGVHVAEISKLLDKAEGNPLTTILETIDWRSVYASHQMDCIQHYTESAVESGY